MELVHFKPFADTDGSVEGLLHTPILEMEERRETFPAVVLCPGGAYAFVSRREADPVALRFFAAGYQVFILTYSVGEKAKEFLPLRELSETLCRIRGRQPSGMSIPAMWLCAAFPQGATWPALWASCGTIRSFSSAMTTTAEKTGPTP